MSSFVDWHRDQDHRRSTVEPGVNAHKFINYEIGASLGKAPMHGFDQEDPAGG